MAVDIVNSLTDRLYDIGEQYSIREIGLQVVDNATTMSDFQQVMIRPVTVYLTHTHTCTQFVVLINYYTTHFDVRFVLHLRGLTLAR